MPKPTEPSMNCLPFLEQKKWEAVHQTARNVSDIGISALNARETDVGMPSGILITQFFLIANPKMAGLPLGAKTRLPVASK